MKALASCCVVVGLLLTGLGCTGDRPPLGMVTGTVTLDEKPLAHAGILFQPESGRPSYGMTDSGGRYTLEYALGVPGAVVGRHTIYIRTRFDGNYPGDPNTRPEQVPARYNDETDLNTDVKAGKNALDFNLTSSPGDKPRKPRRVVSS